MLIASQVLKGVYAVAVAAVLIAALRPQSLSSSQPTSTAQPQQPVTQPSPQQQTSIQPAPVAQLPPSPVAVPSPEPLPEVYDPGLRSWIEAVQTWDVETINQWRHHCAYFNGGQGLPEPDSLICKAIELRQ